MLLKVYAVSAGGGIVIVPDDAGLVHLYSFNELKVLAPDRLLQLHVPTSHAPVPPRLLYIERELSQSLSRLLIGDVGNLRPSA